MTFDEKDSDGHQATEQEEVDWLPLEKIIKRHTTPIGASRMWLSIDNPRQSKAEDVKKGLIRWDEKTKQLIWDKHRSIVQK